MGLGLLHLDDSNYGDQVFSAFGEATSCKEANDPVACMRNMDANTLVNMVDTVLARPELKTYAGMGGIKVRKNDISRKIGI